MTSKTVFLLIVSASYILMIRLYFCNAFRGGQFSESRAKKNTNIRRKLPYFQLPKPPLVPSLPSIDKARPLGDDYEEAMPDRWSNSVTSAFFGFVAKLAPKDATVNQSTTAARVQINRLPPSSITLNIQDLPIIGRALSGTYAKIRNPKQQETSIEISSPTDKLGAIRAAGEEGNLQLTLTGLLSSFIEIQLQPNQPGVAPVEVKSSLIPQWPFVPKRRSQWNRVVNMGNGEIFYYNEKTGETQLEEPTRFY